MSKVINLLGIRKIINLQKNNNCDSCCYIIRKALRILWILGAFRFLV